MRIPDRQSGFTLVEMIMVIVITGIIGGIVATFLRWPVQGYVDSARRAELTDSADTAFRRMAREVRTAVPNSVRTTNCVAPCFEFIPTKAGGRYRAEGPGNTLDFDVADGSFDIVGAAIDFRAGATPDYIVVGSVSPTMPYDQTVTGSLRRYTGAGGLQPAVTMDATALPGWAATLQQRFGVVDGTQRAVTYACEGALGADADGNGTARLVRYWNYGFNVAPAVNSAILANWVSACSIVYDLPSQRMGLVSLQLTLSKGGESVRLYNEMHVNNAP